MTLTVVRLANFKAFGVSQRIPLRPITPIFGANSDGKSSVIHALAHAHHAVGTGELDTQRTEVGGEAIGLGGFREYVHRREREWKVEVGFELDPRRLSGRVADFLRPARAVQVDLGIGAALFERECQRRLHCCFRRGMNLRIVRLQEGLEGEHLHNRHILTDLGGVLFGVVLDEGHDGATDDVHLLDLAQYAEWWQG